MSERKQIVVERGVITFDGQVIESFGFGMDPSQRLLDAIRAATPNLKEGG